MFKQPTPLKVALIYAAFATLWIITSGKLLMLSVDDAVILGRIEQAKGLLFVIVTSGLLYLLIKYWHVSLQQSIETNHDLMNSALDAVVSINQHGKIIGWNPQAEVIFGYSSEQAIGREVAELIVPPAYRNAHRLGMAKFVETAIPSIIGKHIEIQGLRADGCEFPIELTIVALMHNNKRFFNAYIRDITERKKTEETVIAREKEFRLLAEAMPQIVWITSPDGGTTYLNQQWMDYTGLTLEESYGHGWNKPFHPDDQQRAWDAWQNAVNNSGIYAIESRLRRADGVYRWWLIRGVPVLNEQGEVYKWFGTCTDIHEIKETEKALQEKQRFLTDSQAIAHVGSWMLDLNTGILSWSDETFRLYGLSPLTDKQPTAEDLLELLHSDDVFLMRSWITACASGKQPSSFEFRTCAINGSYRWLLSNGVLETDQNGKPLRMIGTVQDITERKKFEETIYDLAFYDPLTRLPNRRLMLDRLKQSLLSRALKSRYGAVLFINLDNFRSLNDSKGHAVGDLLLVAVSHNLQAIVHKDDTVARVGSDEFVVLLDAFDIATDLAAAQAESVAKRILAVINQPLDLEGYEYRCSASIGISLFRGDAPVAELIKQADIAMQQAKLNGANTISFFDPSIQAALEYRVQLETWMHKALNDQYRLYYQIQVDEKGKATGAESLIRWHHPEQGVISPADFIPLAEETGLILSIGKWVLETACAQIKAWENNKNTQYLILAVNVSARQFAQPDFVEQVLTILEQTGANPDKLKLELTESMLVNNVEEIIVKMNTLKAKGVRFSLDDFGTGFSSLTYLKRLPFNQLKIDQSFVRDALTDASDAAIINTVIALGQSLGMDVIAEGVETEQHRSFLATHGCHHYQGYLFSKPLPLEAFEQLLRKLDLTGL